MSKLLYKIGKTAYSKPWLFITGWLLVIALIITAITTNGVTLSSELKLEGTESQDVLDQLEEDLPSASGSQGSFIFEVPEDEAIDDPKNLEAIATMIGDIYDYEYVVNPMDMVGDEAEMAQMQELQQQIAASGRK